MRVVLGLLILGASLLVGCAGTRDTRSESATVPDAGATRPRNGGHCGGRYAALLDAIYDPQDPYQSFSIDNHHVRVTSRAVLRVVEQDLPIVPCLIQRMRDPATDFNRFVRYYSAATIILDQRGSDGTGRFWTGGARATNSGGDTCMEPGSQRFDQAFRDRVTQSLEAEYAVARATKRP